MRTWTTIDKSDWPRGPWDDEPDKAQWIDDTGLDCLIVRQRGGGYLCGYVGVPPEHPWHGVDYDGCLEGCGERWCSHGPDSKVDVHGSLTFAAACRESDDPSRGICHIPEPGRPDDVWWFGFDCAHAFDLEPARDISFDSMYRDFDYVKSECERLAEQLAEVTS
jgi:hypothetical protein